MSASCEVDPASADLQSLLRTKRRPIESPDQAATKRYQGNAQWDTSSEPTAGATAPAPSSQATAGPTVQSSLPAAGQATQHSGQSHEAKKPQSLSSKSDDQDSNVVHNGGSSSNQDPESNVLAPFPVFQYSIQDLTSEYDHSVLCKQVQGSMNFLHEELSELEKCTKAAMAEAVGNLFLSFHAELDKFGTQLEPAVNDMETLSETNDKLMNSLLQTKEFCRSLLLMMQGTPEPL